MFTQPEFTQESKEFNGAKLEGVKIIKKKKNLDNRAKHLNIFTSRENIKSLQDYNGLCFILSPILKPTEI